MRSLLLVAHEDGEAALKEFDIPLCAPNSEINAKVQERRRQRMAMVTRALRAKERMSLSASTKLHHGTLMLD